MHPAIYTISALAAAAGAAATTVLYERHITQIGTHPGFGIDSSVLLRRRMALMHHTGSGRYDVICGDIDHMKALNSGPEGYALTNRLVCGAFAALRVRASDVVSIGQGQEGDEFVVIVRRTRPGAGPAVAKRLQSVMADQPVPPTDRDRLAALGMTGLSATLTVVESVSPDQFARAVSFGMQHTLQAKTVARGGIHIVRL